MSRHSERLAEAIKQRDGTSEHEVEYLEAVNREAFDLLKEINRRFCALVTEDVWYSSGEASRLKRSIEDFLDTHFPGEFKPQ